MNVSLKVKNGKELQEILSRTESAVKELKDCLWELNKFGIEVEVSDEKE